MTNLDVQVYEDDKMGFINVMCDNTDFLNTRVK